jgi:hypothetical protein
VETGVVADVEEDSVKGLSVVLGSSDDVVAAIVVED